MTFLQFFSYIRENTKWLCFPIECQFFNNSCGNKTAHQCNVMYEMQVETKTQKVAGTWIMTYHVFRCKMQVQKGVCLHFRNFSYTGISYALSLWFRTTFHNFERDTIWTNIARTDLAENCFVIFYLPQTTDSLQNCIVIVIDTQSINGFASAAKKKLKYRIVKKCWCEIGFVCRHQLVHYVRVDCSVSITTCITPSWNMLRKEQWSISVNDGLPYCIMIF